MPDPGFEWNWFLFNLIWLPPIAVYYIVQAVKGHRLRKEQQRIMAEHNRRLADGA